MLQNIDITFKESLIHNVCSIISIENLTAVSFEQMNSPVPSSLWRLMMFGVAGSKW